MSEEIWRLPQVSQFTTMSRSWVYAAVKAGDFPAPVKIGHRAIGWRRTDVETWLQNRSRSGGST